MTGLFHMNQASCCIAYWSVLIYILSDFQSDGVVILNDSMPYGDPGWKYAEGDTLTHEVGHWLGLQHTHSDKCRGVGDYMDDAGGVTSNERSPTFDCPIGLDNCNGDGGPNPIHSFMACEC